MRRQLWLAFLAATVCGCVLLVPPATPPPAPSPVATIVVLPATNRTGDLLLVAGGSMLEHYVFHTARVTVPDLLAVEAGEILRARGVSVAAPEIVAAALARRSSPDADDAVAALADAHLDGAALRLDVWRWEADDVTHPARVIVGLDASLIDVATRRVLWRRHGLVRPIPTPGAVTIGGAYEIAARAAVAEMLASWPRVD